MANISYTNPRTYKLKSYESDYYIIVIDIDSTSFPNYISFYSESDSLIYSYMGGIVNSTSISVQAMPDSQNLVSFYNEHTSQIPRSLYWYNPQTNSIQRVTTATITSMNLIFSSLIILMKYNDVYYGISNEYPYNPNASTPMVFMTNSPTTTTLGSAIFKVPSDSEFFTNALTRIICTDFGEWLEGNYTPFDRDSPYSAGGDTPDPDDGGDGEFDYTNDVIDIPDLPSVSVTDSGMVSLYAPTETQLKSLADYLWSDLFSLETFKKIFNNPMDAILGLYLLPVNVGTGAAKEITVGNIVTTVSCNTVTTQFVAVDCGTFTFDKSAFTNSFLDWSPYTKVYLYLPFIGTQEISVDEFMGTTMHVVYHVDVLTGAMICYVANNVQGVLYEYMGQCAENVPLSSTSYSNTVGSILNAAASVGGVVATAVTGGAAAPVALGMLAGASSATAQAASSLKPSVSHSGNIGGGAGMMGVKYPYLIFVTPRTSIPQSQYKYTGTPSNKVVTLSSLQGSGFNQIEAINLSVAGATDTECAEIENTLKAGVIL